MSSDSLFVFIPETIKDSTAFPFSPDRISDPMPDMYFWLSMVVLALVAILRTFYPRHFENLIRSAFSYTLTEKLSKESGLLQKRVMEVSLGLYVLSASLYIYALSREFEVRV